MATFQDWDKVFAVIKPIADRYGFSIHKGWKHLINKEFLLTLKIRISKNSKNQDMIEVIPPVNGSTKPWVSRLDVFLGPCQFEDWIRSTIGLPTLADRDRQLSQIAAEIERCDQVLILSELNPIADPSETLAAKEYKESLYSEIQRIDPVVSSDQSDEDLLIELGVLEPRTQQDQTQLIEYLSALNTPTLEAMARLDWSTFDRDPDVIEITRQAIATELEKRKNSSSDDLPTPTAIADSEVSHNDPIAADLECFAEYKAILATLGIGAEDSLTDVALILHEATRNPTYDDCGLYVPLFEAEERLGVEYPHTPLIPPPGSRPVYWPQVPPSQIESEAINVEATEIKPKRGPRQAVYRNLLDLEHRGQADWVETIVPIDPPPKTKKPNANQLGLF